MLKKKLIPSKLTVKKKLPPPPVEDEVEDEVDVEEEPGEEKEEDEEEDEEETPRPTKKKGKAKSALARAFAAVPLSGNSIMKAGLYLAIVRSFILQPPDARGISVRINVELCDPEIEEADRHRVDWRKIIDADGQPVGGGIRAFANDLAHLGYEIPDIDEDFEDNLQAIFDEIGKERPGINLKVFNQRGNDGTEYAHFAIQGVSEDEVIEEYKNNIPF